MSQKRTRLLSWVVRIVASAILFQTLFFKISGAPESVYIFQTMGMEPAGRYLTAIVELIAGVLMMIPSTVWLGSGLSLGVISGAIFVHLTKLGIEVQNDGGLLFMLAITVFICSGVALYIDRKQIPFLPPN